MVVIIRSYYPITLSIKVQVECRFIGISVKLGSDLSVPNIFVFLELLNVLTIGNRSENRKLFYELVSEAHLAYIEKLMLGGGAKLFFVSNGVLREIAKLKKRYPLF